MDVEIDRNVWPILEKMYQIEARSSRLCSYGFPSIKRALAKLESVSWLITSGVRCTEGHNVKSLVDELCQARLIPMRIRQEALRDVETKINATKW